MLHGLAFAVSIPKICTIHIQRWELGLHHVLKAAHQVHLSLLLLTSNKRCELKLKFVSFLVFIANSIFNLVKLPCRMHGIIQRGSIFMRIPLLEWLAIQTCAKEERWIMVWPIEIYLVVIHSNKVHACSPLNMLFKTLNTPTVQIHLKCSLHISQLAQSRLISTAPTVKFIHPILYKSFSSLMSNFVPLAPLFLVVKFPFKECTYVVRSRVIFSPHIPTSTLPRSEILSRTSRHVGMQSSSLLTATCTYLILPVKTTISFEIYEVLTIYFFVFPDYWQISCTCIYFL